MEIGAMKDKEEPIVAVGLLTLTDL